MRKWAFAIAALLATSAVGCATTAEDERREAAIHRQRAANAAAVGDYQTAAREQREAYKAEREAADKSLDEMEEGKAPPPPPPQYGAPPAPEYRVVPESPPPAGY